MLTVAIVYDRVNTPFGGAEKVLLALHQAFPQAPLFTSVYNIHQAQWADMFEVKPSFLQNIPGASRWHRPLAPFMPLAFESLDLCAYDIIISVTSAEAKGVITKPDQLHLCYLLTPTRYLYSHRREYEATLGPFQPIAQEFFDYLTWWDQAAAHRPDFIIPISNRVQQRTQTYYHRSSQEVIYPPIELAPKPSTTECQKSLQKFKLPTKFLLVVSRLVSYKKIHLAIKAAQITQQPLVIVGTGPDEDRLKSMGSENIYFLSAVNHNTKLALMASASVLLMPGEEDFGITALEAPGLETPVILHHASGAAELLPDEEVSLHLNKTSVQDLVSKLHFLTKTKFRFGRWRQNMRKYDTTHFVSRFQQAVEQLWQRHQKGKL